jgi:hypothetical protein
VGVIVGHDPFTGLVRGRLCSGCNAWIDVCPHLRGCPRAAYLNDPPARHLQLSMMKGFVEGAKENPWSAHWQPDLRTGGAYCMGNTTGVDVRAAG